MTTLGEDIKSPDESIGMTEEQAHGSHGNDAPSSWSNMFIMSMVMNLVAVLYGLYWYYTSNRNKHVESAPAAHPVDKATTNGSKATTSAAAATNNNKNNDSVPKKTKKKVPLSKKAAKQEANGHANGHGKEDDLAPTAMMTPEEQREKQKQMGLMAVAHFVRQLGPDSTHLDVLYAIASTPDSIMFGTKGHRMMEAIKEERRLYLLEEEQEVQKQLDEERRAKGAASSSANGKKNGKSKVKNDNLMFDLDDEGWDQDNDSDDEETKRKEKLAAEEEAEKQRIREQIQGKRKNNDEMNKRRPPIPPVEGVDDGVLGQVWMENTLSRKGLWPPPNLGILANATFEFDGKKNLSALEHPGLRRNLVMVMARIHAVHISKNPELLAATETQALDPTFFVGSKEFRARAAMNLEAAFRAALTCRSYALAKTICETIVIFKIGREKDAGTEQWFSTLMRQMYQCQPGISIANKSITKKMGKKSPPDNDDDDGDDKEEKVDVDSEKTVVATGETLELAFDMTREHAENFTRQKIMVAQQRNIPPQQLLQAHRETWCIMVQAKKMGGAGSATNTVDIKAAGMLEKVREEDLDKFRTVKLDGTMIAAYPLVVQNIAQKKCKVKMQMLGPTVPGKYKFVVSVLSQDFFNADQSFSVKVTVTDSNDKQNI